MRAATGQWMLTSKMEDRFRASLFRGGLWLGRFKLMNRFFCPPAIILIMYTHIDGNIVCHSEKRQLLCCFLGRKVHLISIDRKLNSSSFSFSLSNGLTQ